MTAINSYSYQYTYKNDKKNHGHPSSDESQTYHQPVHYDAHHQPINIPETGNTAENPYILPADSSSVPFSAEDSPAFLSLNDVLYTKNADNPENAIGYTGLDDDSKTLTLNFSGESSQSDTIIGYDKTKKQMGTKHVKVGIEKTQVGTKEVQVGTEQVQVGTEQVQVGTEQVEVGTETFQSGTEQVQIGTEQVEVGTETFQSGTEQVQVGTEQVEVGTETFQSGIEQVQVGTEQIEVGTETFQSGTEQVQVGTEQVQVGTEKVQTGTKKVQVGTEKVQTGTEKYQSGTKKVQVDTEKVQTGTEKYQSGTKKVQVGTEKVQTGTEKYQSGTEKVQVGTEQVKVGYGQTGVETKTIHDKIAVNRELDGRENGGAIGDILDKDTSTSILLDPGKANEFFTTNAGKYQTSGLLSEDNASNGAHVNILTKTDSDDMYVAGDPFVGGKGNNYAPDEITPGSGFITMHEDGLADGRKVTINARVDEINPEGNRAFTEYGFIVQDDNGDKTTAVLSGGELKIDGQALLPGQEKIIGNPADPVARFFYDSRPGGENGSNEARLVFESFEKVSPKTREQLLDAGANPDEVDALRSRYEANFGFRIPDGDGSFRSSDGVDGGLSTTNNGVKTYYDAHFLEPDSFELKTKKTIEKPVYGPIYEEKPIYKEKPVYKERPIYEEKPIYKEKPVYKERPVYEEKPIYKDKPVYKERPVYEEKPIFKDKPIFSERPVFEEQPIFEDRPVFSERPVFEEQPIFEDRPVFSERPVFEEQPIFEDRPVFSERPVFEEQPIFEDRPIFSERPVFEEQPIFEDRPIFEEQPVFKEKPIFDKRPIYKEIPVFKKIKTPIYETNYDVAIDAETHQDPVAADEQARIWGDPHVVGADGGKYDFQETGTYSILKDADIEVNTEMTSIGTNKKGKAVTVNTKAGITVENNGITVNADGETVVQNFTTNQSQTLANDDSLDLGNGNSISKTDKIVTIDSSEYTVQVASEEVRSQNNKNRLDVDIWSKEAGVLADGVAPTGILGETFDADSKKQKKTQLDPADYKVDALINQPDTSSDDDVTVQADTSDMADTIDEVAKTESISDETDDTATSDSTASEPTLLGYAAGNAGSSTSNTSDDASEPSADDSTVTTTTKKQNKTQKKANKTMKANNTAPTNVEETDSADTSVEPMIQTAASNTNSNPFSTAPVNQSFSMDLALQQVLMNLMQFFQAFFGFRI
ncbi:MAG: hypothetical protein AAGI66_05160 [Cyanobacteria bacterium P01_H01_bin.74]